MGFERLPFIGEAEIAAVLRWPDLVDAIEAAMTAFSAGRVVQPVRQMLPVPGAAAFMGAMPAIGSGIGGAAEGAMGVKVVTLFQGNAGTDVPTHQAVILLFDMANGSPLAVLDGRLITEMRTAAGTAAIVRRLTSGSPKTVAILGNGIQARAHAGRSARCGRSPGCACGAATKRVPGRSPRRSAPSSIPKPRRRCAMPISSSARRRRRSRC